MRYQSTADTTTVTSANDGGLESNGDLAVLCQRNKQNKKQIVLQAKKRKKVCSLGFFAKSTGLNIDFSR
jgi:hypothetical protein